MFYRLIGNMHIKLALFCNRTIKSVLPNEANETYLPVETNLITKSVVIRNFTKDMSVIVIWVLCFPSTFLFDQDVSLNFNKID